jgi:hypothetical protein
MRTYRKITGVTTLLLGVIIVSFALLAFYDPADSQLSNDSDPSGSPLSPTQVWGQTFGGLILIVAGVRLLSRKDQT